MIGLRVFPGNLSYEMENMVRMFFPGTEMHVSRTDTPGGEHISAETINGQAQVSVSFDQYERRLAAQLPDSCGQDEQERQLAELLYRLLREYTGMTPPWGVLTGVRPTRFYRRLLQEGTTADQAADYLATKCLVHPSRIRLLERIADQQRPVLQQYEGQGFSLYVSIPFCPTRCRYCSFVSHSIEKAGHLVPAYLELLCRELSHTAALTRSLGLDPAAVYIGGGTPTILTADQMKQLLRAIRQEFNGSGLREYTVEAGRPDTISREKLAVLREFGVSRISVNPQSMNDGVLQCNGRTHTAESIYRAYETARQAGFESINMDLILGLPGDNGDAFTDSVRQVVALEPENITVHTLTLKRSSAIRTEGLRTEPMGKPLDLLLDEARELLGAAGYQPYYVYRQKAGVDNLDNTGYAKPGSAGIYNILSMEDCHTIFATGAGAATKICLPDGQLKRFYNFKYPWEYRDRFAEILERKNTAAGYLK